MLYKDKGQLETRRDNVALKRLAYPSSIHTFAQAHTYPHIGIHRQALMHTNADRSARGIENTQKLQITRPKHVHGLQTCANRIALRLRNTFTLITNPKEQAHDHSLHVLITK